MVGDCLFSSEAKLWNREELCEVSVLRDKVPMMSYQALNSLTTVGLFTGSLY